MRMRNKLKYALVGAAGLAAAAGTPATASPLLNLVDPPDQTETPYSLSFDATAATTTLTYAGFNVPSFTFLEDNGVYLNGIGPNLLGSSWSFTPAKLGSESFTYNDGSSVPALAFGGVDVGYYDEYSQTIATIPGDAYTVQFLLSAYGEGHKSQLVISTSGAVVPEPAALALMLTGITGLGGATLAGRSRRKAA